MADFLQVQTQDGPVGRVGFDAMEERFSFAYDDGWRARAGAFPLSPHFPLAGGAPASGTVQRFLGNLLPEGRALDVAAAVSKLTKDNIFGLVRILGDEPVGALSFHALAQDAPGLDANSEPGRRVISREELSERIHKRDEIPFPVWDNKVRLSTAGYQDKLQVLLEGDRIAFAEGSLSSTHILKPDSRNAATPHMVANEHFCMSLAARAGLQVAPVSLLRIPEPVLLIQRFDRAVQVNRDDGLVTQVRRLHVIDGCQALDLPVSFKYERNYGNGADVRNIRDGASYEKLFGLSGLMENPALGRRAMVQWALFQLLIGNSDAHGKNISFFMRAAGLTPTPFYDLVSVAAYGAALEQELALAFGDAFALEEVTPFALADFAHRTGTPAAYLARELRRLCKVAAAEAAALASSAMYEGDERALVSDIAGLVARQAERLSRIAPEIRKVDPQNL